jgi:hypothetical protein
MRKWFRVLPLLFLVSAFSAHAEENPVPSTSDPHGAVLCIWSIYVQLQDFGTICGFDPDTGLQPVLAESIIRMDKFITANSDITQQQLDDKKKALLTSDRDRASKSDQDELRKVCAGEGEGGVPAVYRKLAATDPEHIRWEITKLLEIPRKPVMEPCI